MPDQGETLDVDGAAEIDACCSPELGPAETGVRRCTGPDALDAPADVPCETWWFWLRINPLMVPWQFSA